MSIYMPAYNLVILFVYFNPVLHIRDYVQTDTHKTDTHIHKLM